MRHKSNFFASEAGRWVITAICAVLIWGLMYLFIQINAEPITLIMAVICAYFGWRALNRIQPAMFIWMSWVGWLIYFFVKLFISVAIGFFIAPYHIGKSIGGKIHDSIQ